MHWTRFVRAKAVCAYFFVGPGLLYGLFISRMPALKEQTQANEAEIGFILLALGVSALIGLLVSSRLIRRFTSRKVIRVSSLAMALSLPLAACTHSPLTMGLAVTLMGFFNGLVDVAMNAQAIQLEQRFAAPCLALMHGSYSLGGLTAALTGSLFASMGCSPFINYCVIMAIYVLPRPWAVPRLQKDRVIAKRPEETAQPKTGWRRVPPTLVLLCGCIAACCYAGEGTVGEWGALYLFSVKGASEQTAALGYACFSVGTLSCRMFADMARTHFSDFSLALCGSLLAVAGMSSVLASDYTGLCLVGYTCMGFGMAPMVPLCFSHAGRCPKVTPAEASAIVSVLAYGGLLLFPPIIGNLAHAFGLQQALFVGLGLVCMLAVGSFLFRHKH